MSREQTVQVSDTTMLNSIPTACPKKFIVILIAQLINLENKIVYLYICLDFGFRMFGIKREVRCKSGAIPVAVSSILVCLYFMPLL
jgi:hypothetical protein